VIRAMDICQVSEEDAMRIKKEKKLNNQGQSILEYALIATIVAAAAIAMSTYLFRSVQATQQIIQRESRNQ
jgi:uncharacterized protein (UPF0333 family)